MDELLLQLDEYNTEKSNDIPIKKRNKSESNLSQESVAKCQEQQNTHDSHTYIHT